MGAPRGGGARGQDELILVDRWSPSVFVKRGDARKDAQGLAANPKASGSGNW